MSENEFQKKMKALRKRMELMEMARAGHASVQRVKVRTYTVREHEVSAHTRVYFRLAKEPKPATKKAA